MGFLEQIFGTELGLPARAVVALVLVLALIALTVWLMRRFGEGSGVVTAAGGRGRGQRLAVLDSAAVDARRRLVLIRRDNVEHLILIGGPSDVVIEPNIVRAQPAGAVRREARPGAYEEEEEAPLIPETPVEPERPAPAAPPRPAPQLPAEPPRAAAQPAPKLEPQYVDMAQRLEAALRKPGPAPEPAAKPEAPRPAAAPRAFEPRTAEPRMAEPRAQEARPPEPRIPEPRPAPRAPLPRTAERTAEPRLGEPRLPEPQPRPQPAAPSPAPAPASADQAADVFLSLEEEMASLLRPGAKKDPKK